MEVRMKEMLLCLGLAAAAAGGANETPQPPEPVLIELFTSEGCSSCPPADALLASLDHTQPVTGARIIVLSEHVDNWNHLGWADPYSSSAFSQRQEVYARRFGLNGPYTPQMVVDGKTEFVGSDARRAQAAIRESAREPKASVRIEPADPDGDAVNVEVAPLAHGLPRKALVFIAHVADSGSSDVLRGENAGRKLQHVAIVKSLAQVGAVSEHSSFKTRVPMQQARIIAFVQESGNGRVLGAAMYSARP
jgi:hypothetical protein